MNNSFVFSVDVQQNTGATNEVLFRFTDNERWTHKQLQTAIEDRCGIAGSLSTKEDVLLVPGRRRSPARQPVTLSSSSNER